MPRILQDLFGNALAATAPLQQNPAFNAIPVKPDDAARALGYDNADAARKAGFDIPNETHYYHPETGENLGPMKDVTDAASKWGTGTPMRQASFWQRVVNPEAAQQETEYNRNWAMQRPQATQTESIARGILGNRISAAPQTQWAVPGNLPASISSEQGITPAEALQQQTAGAEITGGLPQTQASRVIQEAQNAYRTAGAYGAGQGPEAAGIGEGMSNILGLGRTQYQMAGLPVEAQQYAQRQALEGYQLGYDVPMAQARASTVPTATQIPQLNAVNELMAARYGVPPSGITGTPYLTETTPGGVKLPTGLSPYFRPQQMALMQYYLNGGLMNRNAASGAPISAVGANGQSVPLPPADLGGNFIPAFGTGPQQGPPPPQKPPPPTPATTNAGTEIAPEFVPQYTQLNQQANEEKAKDLVEKISKLQSEIDSALNPEGFNANKHYVYTPYGTVNTYSPPTLTERNDTVVKNRKQIEKLKQELAILNVPKQ